MIDSRLLDEISGALGRHLPPSVRSVKDDFEKNARSVLQSSIERMDLVTREDYDIQVALVSRLRARLDALETRVSELEARAGTAPGSRS